MSNKEQLELIAQLAALKAENEALKVKKERSLSWKVSEKGAISIYGFGRFPVTLYYTQLMKLAQVMPEVCKFAEDNKEKLAIKDNNVVIKAA